MTVKKQDYGEYYKCGACGVLEVKAEWVPSGLEIGHDVRICPNCGTLMAVVVKRRVDG